MLPITHLKVLRRSTSCHVSFFLGVSNPNSRVVVAITMWEYLYWSSSMIRKYETLLVREPKLILGQSPEVVGRINPVSGEMALHELTVVCPVPLVLCNVLTRL